MFPVPWMTPRQICIMFLNSGHTHTPHLPAVMRPAFCELRSEASFWGSNFWARDLNASIPDTSFTTISLTGTCVQWNKRLTYSIETLNFWNTTYILILICLNMYTSHHFPSPVGVSMVTPVVNHILPKTSNAHKTPSTPKEMALKSISWDDLL